MRIWQEFQDWTIGGIDFEVEGNGGLHCRDHVGLNRRVWETLLGIGLPLCLFLWQHTGKSQTKQPSDNNSERRQEKKELHCLLPQGSKNDYSLLRIGFLVSMTLVFGIEMGFKFATKQLIWLFNPCHVTSVIDIYCLAMPVDTFKINNSLFIMTLFTMHGPLAAMLFPTDAGLILPFESEIYWIQHWLLLLVPLYFLLVKDGHGYTAHKMEMRWFSTAFLMWSIWHWGALMWLGYLSWANVGSMLCPAYSDPFAGPNFRLIGIVHQSVAVFAFGSLTARIAEWNIIANDKNEKNR